MTDCLGSFFRILSFLSANDNWIAEKSGRRRKSLEGFRDGCGSVVFYLD